MSEYDIVRGLQKAGPDLLSRKVRDVMSKKVVTCAAEDCAAGITAAMWQCISAMGGA